MDNQIHFEQTPYHHVYLKDRKTLELTGIKKIESFDSLEFLIETSLGYLNIKGSDLALVRFDQEKKRSVLKEILMRFLTYRIKEQQRVKIVF
ncbi:MAG: YabP/YqfC family sporulation protein [Faecalibacillus intestinalis]|uniref:YabP/YqfC family sporulation protein n=1 Tax=Faecalibacillus intestinalis TaxID=1982626 RepID=UPI0039A34D40